MYYLVELEEVHKQKYLVKADTPDEAKDLAYQGEIDGVTEKWCDSQYHRTVENSATIIDKKDSPMKLKMAHSFDEGPSMDNKTYAKEEN